MKFFLLPGRCMQRSSMGSMTAPIFMPIILAQKTFGPTMGIFYPKNTNKQHSTLTHSHIQDPLRLTSLRNFACLRHKLIFGMAQMKKKEQVFCYNVQEGRNGHVYLAHVWKEEEWFDGFFLLPPTLWSRKVHELFFLRTASRAAICRSTNERGGGDCNSGFAKKKTPSLDSGKKVFTFYYHVISHVLLCLFH